MEPRSWRVPACDGVELQVLSWSDAGVPLIMLHGFGNDAHVWDDFAPAVAPYYRTLAFDLRGHGDSSRDPQLRYDHETMASDVIAVTEGLELRRFVLIGHSMGGRVAMRLAGEHPERLAGLIIVDAGPELDARGVSRIRLDAVSDKPTSFASASEYEVFLSSAYPLAKPHVLARMARFGLRRREDGRLEPKTDPAFFRAWENEPAEDAARRAAEETAALWAALARTACPTLVVRGAASDVLSPEVADRMAEQVLPRGSLAVVPRAGHSVMVDNPDGFREAVTSFVLGDA
jgi:pimeloyl-ACP methyl ester carboxylesterase